MQNALSKIKGRKIKHFFVISLGLAIIAFVLIYIFREKILDHVLAASFRETEVHQKEVSPDGRLTAYYFTHEYGAGGTAHFVSILPSTEKFSEAEKYQVVYARPVNGVEIKWDSPLRLKVNIGMQAGSQLRMKDKLGDVEILYHFW